MKKSVACLFLCASVVSAQKQPFTVRAMLALSRISDPQLSPDGKTVAFTVQSIDLETNKKPSRIFVVPVDGGTPKPIASEGSINTRARWFPDSKRLAFTSDRSGSSQIWTVNADGSEPKQVTNISTEASGVLVSPDGKTLVFVSDVYPDCPDDACNRQRLEAAKNSKLQARVYTGLLYRHWTKWDSKTRSHLFAVHSDGGPARDMTAGPRDVPPFSLGGPDDYAISSDSAELCYSMNSDPNPATGTNSDLYTVPLAGGEAKKITTSPGGDSTPVYSPDGKWLAFRSQARAGYESDRWRLMVLDRATGQATELTQNLDRPVQSFTWSPDSTRLFFTLEDHGRQVLYIIPASGGASRLLASGGSIDDVQLTSDGKTMIYSENSGTSPTELYRTTSAGGAPVALTHINDGQLANYSLPKLEELWTDSPDGAKVESFVVKPPDFVPSRKYPVLFLIHGGPQGAWGESWSYRWNPQVFASAGYVVVMPNPRGSVGYGQKFTDEVNGDWGGRAYHDIMSVADNVAKLPYADAERMAAAGGSYGGYMVDWILGHSQRFKALISHAGVYDLRSMVGETEELWFPLWEFHGMPWQNPELYEKLSPSSYAADFHTPTLVIDGELDYRVPYGQGLQLYTALQLQKVPSKLVLFPDEGHWILKPQNSVFWYDTFLEWIGEWLKKPAALSEKQ